MAASEQTGDHEATGASTTEIEPGDTRAEFETEPEHESVSETEDSAVSKDGAVSGSETEATSETEASEEDDADSEESAPEVDAVTPDEGTPDEATSDEPTPEESEPEESEPEESVPVPAVTGEHMLGDLTAVPAASGSAAPALANRRNLIIGALAVVLLLIVGVTITEAVKVRGDLVAGTLLSPDAYLAQVVPVEVDGVEHRHTLSELGWTTTATDSLTGGLFARLRLHNPIGPAGGPAESGVVRAYQSELHRDPTLPVINAGWNVVEGDPGVTSEVSIVGSSPPLRIVVSPLPVEPQSSASLQRFVEQRNRDVDGWEIKLLDDDGTLGATLEPEEVAAHIEFDRESASVNIVDEVGFRELLDERLRPFAREGRRGRYQFEVETDEDGESVDGGATLVVEDGRLNILDVLTASAPGKVPDVDQAWTDLVDSVKSFGRSVPIRLVDAEDLYGGIDPADLGVKLAESRTPNTGGSRMTNIRNVLNRTRGIVVEPGGVFGINQTVGQRTVAKGFVLAGAISNGEHVDAFGGGISQTATMFHQVGYMAGLTFPEREGGGIGGGHKAFGHSEYFGRYNDYYAEGWGLDGKMDTGRLGYGVEQTVNWRNREAGFINTTPYPILVWTFDTGRQVGVSLWSLERDRFGVYEGTDSWRRGSCIDWTHYRTVYDMDGNVMFEDSYSGFYRTTGPTCALVHPDKDDDE